MKSQPTLQQLDARLHEHALEMAGLRAAFEIQLQRIAQMQAELDVLPRARKRRQSLSTRYGSHNGNGRGHR